MTNLSPQLVLHGYQIGIFPMADGHGAIYWFSPDPRCIFPLDAFHVPKSMRPLLNRNAFEIRINTALTEVMAACSDRHDGTWIDRNIARVYTELHHQGFVHSLECWQDDRLVGGLYGVAIGGAFFGESMFSRVTDASKYALIKLHGRLVARGYQLLDTQWQTPHLKRFGAVEIPRDEYLARLVAALDVDCTFGD